MTPWRLGLIIPDKVRGGDWGWLVQREEEANSVGKSEQNPEAQASKELPKRLNEMSEAERAEAAAAIEKARANLRRGHE
ncbi:hypothetical protein [Synechococcus sp. PCC 6312]|uniref:hypothetical protein n=1 Tax=Synechococcus sp. (strain ATCC 27167 / PCC 6312) TaxID=195253 RepID=UPI00029F4123|nr:hypothetical protein [Synechococcus sp. PCC 6312]AFY60332.1 hypothetical protein Syn6312_1143 [Synechococcus sp. PCC 6312]